MGNIASYQQWNLTAKYYNRYRLVEPYFQDDWRATKRLTFNLGLRLSLFGTYRERYRRAFNFEPTAFVSANTPVLQGDGSLTPGVGNALNGVIQCGGPGGTVTLPGFGSANVGSSSNAGCLKGHLFNPAPRFGFAFDPKGDGKMAIRGGYGVFFEHTNGNEGNTESLEGSAPLALNATQSNITGYQNIGAGALVPLFPLGVNSIPNKSIWPYVQQWHLDVQRELPSHVVATISYVGSKGTHLTMLNDSNQLLPVSTSANPYKPGEAIGANGHDDCGTMHTPSGVPVTGQAAINLGVACGGNADTQRTGFPGLSDIFRLEDTANSSYHALQTSARRTVGDLTLSLAYTYSHAVDDSSDRFDNNFVNSFDIRQNRANSS